VADFHTLYNCLVYEDKMWAYERIKSRRKLEICYLIFTNFHI
jgi:hypothetical protein